MVMAETAPRVYVVDDDATLREALVFLLASRGVRAEGFASAEEFLSRFGGHFRGCVLTDMRMGGMSGLELFDRLGTAGSQLPCIVLTGHGDVPMAVEAMRAGGVDFIEKPFDNEVLLQSIHAALDLQAERAGRGDERRRFEEVLAGLSPRETDVLRGVIAGKMNKVIARDLGISPRTVEVYRANVMSKTHARGLSELARIAILAGF